VSQPAPPPIAQPAPQQQQGEVRASAANSAPRNDTPSDSSETPRRDSRNRQEQPRRPFDASTLNPSGNQQQGAITLPPAGAVQSPIANPQVDGRLLGNPTAPLPPAPPAAAAPQQAAPQNSPSTPPQGGRFVPAVRLSGITPKLPPFAQQLSIRKGTVTLVVNVDSRGIVRSVNPLDGHPVLAAAAKDAVMSWKYRPATLNGTPVESKVEVHILFQESK
jgi:protein TonB